MTDKPRIAVLGMAHDHLWGNLKDLCAAKDAELVGGADPSPDLRRLFCESSGCSKTFEDFEELLEAEKPDAVFGFSAPSQHADIVEMCAERGVHVMVEKPMAATLAQADRMLTAARSSGIRLMVNWPTAWQPKFATALRLVREERLGRLWQITWRGGHGGPEELGCSPEFCRFLFDRELNGSGAFTDYGGYGASLCLLFLSGSPNSVMAMAGRLVKTHLAVEDNGILLMRYPQALCRLEMTWSEAVPMKSAHDLVLYGTEGTLAVGEEIRLFTRQHPDGEAIVADPPPRASANATRHFVRCIVDGLEPEGLTSPDLSRAAQEIVEAGLRSATSGVEISLPLEDHLFRPC